MALKIKKKKNEGKNLAVITILGIQGSYIKNEAIHYSNFDNKADYYFEDYEDVKKDYFNTLPLLTDKFTSKGYEIIPIYTNDSKIINQDIIKKGYSNLKKNINFNDDYLIEDEKDIDNIFKIYNNIFEKYDEVIVDVTHGFRHLPLLMIVELIIQNFKSVDKIKHIYFAKEIEKHEKHKKGLYEIIDLKHYVDLANISFILTSFSRNFTVANHITSKKYSNLTTALNNFSNDIMALSLNNLFQNSSKDLIKELNKITDISIAKQAAELSKYIKQVTSYEGKKKYQTYLDLSKELFERNYMLISLSLLYESIRFYIKSTIKVRHKNSVEKIETEFNNDLYKIGDFFVKFKNDNFDYSKFEKSWKNDSNTKNKTIPLNQNEFSQIKISFPKSLLIENKYNIAKKPLNIIDAIAYTRNNLAHGNVKDNFSNIKSGIKDLLDSFENICLKEAKEKSNA